MIDSFDVCIICRLQPHGSICGWSDGIWCVAAAGLRLGSSLPHVIFSQ